MSDPGEYDSYNVISLSFFSDGTVAYENGETVDDIDSTVGAQALFNLTMGMDIVHVRNDRLRCFFEITSDLRTYFEAFGEEACV